MRNYLPMQGGWLALLETSSELGCLLAPDGTLLEASPGWRRSFGEAPPRAQLHPCDLASFDRLLLACRAGQQRATLRLGGEAELHELTLTSHEGRIVLNVTRSLGRVWHDLLTPINVIQGFAELLQEAQLTADQREFLTDILDAAENLRRLIAQAASR